MPDDDQEAGPRFRLSIPKEAVEGSDFVQAATAAWDPVFDGHWVEKGMYVASIGGSDASNKRREIDDECIRRADVYFVHSKEVARIDQSPDVWEVAQKGIKTWDSIRELQDLVAGKVAGRTRPDQITFFNNNTGAGTQFAAVGAAVLKRARAGIGKRTAYGVVPGGCVPVMVNQERREQLKADGRTWVGSFDSVWSRLAQGLFPLSGECEFFGYACGCDCVSVG